MDIDQIYGFEKGWALKGNQKYSKKSGEIYNSLQEFVVSGEVEKENVPNMSIIKNWINAYSAEFKEQQRKKK
ncbi:6296_t:CDS:2 [Gigaspora margarita]|uniref:6296_t:CDS:1 n=1 Tax=Gigaspora margarita TaxID=4874 RepID=A0ABN7V5X2_GIGMA|nr:6296_t:CDS:2 [Gigaspora margarita]